MENEVTTATNPVATVSPEPMAYDLTKASNVIEVAGHLKKFIEENNLTVKIAGRPYVQVEGWQFVGSQLGLYPVLVESKNESSYEPVTFTWKDKRNNPRSCETKRFKYRATVEIRSFKDDRVYSKGIMICTNEEFGKHEFDEYAVESMAQTRAQGKAYRLLLAWIVKAAGYEQTPAEEMDDKKVEFYANCPTAEEKRILINLVYESTLLEDARKEAFATIAGCVDYELYSRIRYRLEQLRKPIDMIQNPSAKQINEHLKNTVINETEIENPL